MRPRWNVLPVLGLLVVSGAGTVEGQVPAGEAGLSGRFSTTATVQLRAVRRAAPVEADVLMRPAVQAWTVQAAERLRDGAGPPPEVRWERMPGQGLLELRLVCGGPGEGAASACVGPADDARIARLEIF